MTDDRDPDNAPRSRALDRGVIAVGLMVLAAVGWFIYRQRSTRGELAAVHGHPAGAVLVHGGAQGDTLVVIDRVSAPAANVPAYRLASIDPLTGKVLASRVVDEPEKCWAASPGKLWCSNDTGHLHLLAVPGLQAAQETEGDTKARQIVEPRCELVDSVDPLAFGPGSPRPLMRGSDAAPGAPAFLAPSFLHVDDSSLVLVLHDVALDHPGAQALSRVEPDLHVDWTVPLGARCETAGKTGTLLVITTPDPHHRAFAIDLASGKLAWQFAFAESH